MGSLSNRFKVVEVFKGHKVSIKQLHKVALPHDVQSPEMRNGIGQQTQYTTKVCSFI